MTDVTVALDIYSPYTYVTGKYNAAANPPIRALRRIPRNIPYAVV